MVRRMPTKLNFLALAVALTACAGVPDTSFGQNVVRYDDFDFKILETEHFDIYYYDEERDAAIQYLRSG